MTEATRQAALGALGTARAAVARLNSSRHPEDTAADLIEIWGSVETALRALLNGSPLSGQDLVREVRKREMITLSQAHALLDFLAVRERVNDTSYRPTAADADTARTAVSQLEGSLVTAPPADLSAGRAPSPAAAPPPQVSETPPSRRRRFGSGVPTWAWIALALVALAGAGAATYYALGDRDELAAGRRALREGRREAARAEFERVVREDPRNAEAHLFLARLAREQQDYAGARRHAEAAIRGDTGSALGYREMGAVLYVTGNYDAARRFLVRAVERNGTDATANGLLACSLWRLGHAQMSERFFARAGAGPWSQCRQQ